MDELDKVRSWVERPEGERPLIVAAGGDGTIGSVAGHVVNTGAVLGILPLGTHNDVARSLGLPLGIEDAVRVLATGAVSKVDGARFIGQDGTPRYFVQAAAIGIQVAFARQATRVSLRRRLGRLTYIVAAALALSKGRPFSCELELQGRHIPLRLLHLSIINAPVFGGLFDLRVPGSRIDDRRLDVLAIAPAPLHHLLWAALLVVLSKEPRMAAVRVYHARQLRVDIAEPRDISLDGEVCARVPGQFMLVPDALRVVTPPGRKSDDDGDQENTG